MFAYIAETDPQVLLTLERLGLLVLDDHLPTPMARLLRHGAWKRVGRRLKQTRQA